MMKADLMKAALGKKGGRRRDGLPAERGGMNRFRRKRCHRLGGRQEGASERKGRERPYNRRQ